MEPWYIRVSPWIIQDGNYKDFRRGQVTDFALDIYAPHGFRQVEDQEPKAVRLGECRYQITAKVAYSDSLTLVLDFGLLAYRYYRESFQKGSTVEGEIHLGIDSCIYFESLFAKPSMPALIYRWRIDQILRESAPLVEGKAQDGRRALVWDDTRKKVETVDCTDAWGDESEAGLDRRKGVSYILVCTRTDAIARMVREPTTE